MAWPLHSPPDELPSHAGTRLLTTEPAPGRFIAPEGQTMPDRADPVARPVGYFFPAPEEGNPGVIGAGTFFGCLGFLCSLLPLC